MAAAVAFGPATGSLRIQIVDGSRQPMPDEVETLLRVVDWHKQPVTSAFAKGSQAVFSGLPFAEHSAERYSVYAHARGYRDALLFPVRPAKNTLVDAAVLLVPENGRYRFDALDVIDGAHPLIRRVLSRACDYQSVQQASPRSLATLLNVCAAMETMPLPDAEFRTPLHYDWQAEWNLMEPARVWAWVDVRFIEGLRRAGCLHAFAQEPNPEVFHPGIPGKVGPATSSWNEIRFDVANVKFSFHEHDRRTLDLVEPTGETRAVDCVMVEAEIDYWSDLVNLGRTQFLPGSANRETLPELAYQLRWMASRQERLPDFDPPYGIEAA